MNQNVEYYLHCSYIFTSQRKRHKWMWLGFTLLSFNVRINFVHRQKISFISIATCNKAIYCKRIIVHWGSMFLDFLILTPQGTVISYLYTIPWQNSLSKSRVWRCSWCKIAIVCQPIRTIFSIRVQWIYNFHLPFQWRTCFV